HYRCERKSENRNAPACSDSAKPDAMACAIQRPKRPAICRAPCAGPNNRFRQRTRYLAVQCVAAQLCLLSPSNNQERCGSRARNGKQPANVNDELSRARRRARRESVVRNHAETFKKDCPVCGVVFERVGNRSISSSRLEETK